MHEPDMKREVGRGNVRKGASWIGIGKAEVAVEREAEEY